MKQPQEGGDDLEEGRRTNWTIVALIAGLILLVMTVLYFTRSGNPGQDKLTNAEVASSKPPASREKLCASSATYELIKHDLFRRAEQLRGSDQATFEKLAGYAVVRMENPVMVSQDSATGAVNCSGSLSLDLPPGVAVVGGRRTLMSDVDYTVAPAADGSGAVVLLRNSDPIVTLLATLQQLNTPVPPQSPDLAAANEAAPESTSPSAPGVPQAPTKASPPAAAPRPISARPSFDCATARTRGEIAVCNSPALAALDRQMAADYARARAAASPDQRALLRDTARRFYDFRDRCQTDACISDAYTGRMREIGDIMEDRWQPPR